MSTKLNKAFRALRKAGFIAKQNFGCCQICAWSDIPDEAENVVFYHHQDNERKLRGEPFYLVWRGDGNKISEIFREQGITVVWDGRYSQRIQLSDY